MTLPVSRCRSCNEKVIWTRTQGGQRMPVDAEPREGAQFAIFDVDGVLVLIARKKVPPGDWHYHDSHFSTCPNADAHRRPR